MNVRYDMVTVFVVRADAAGASHEFLQLRRAAADEMGGTFQTVRGRSYAGETAVDAALRELDEETSLRPAEFYRLGSCEVFYLPAAETIWHSPAFCAIVDRSAEPVLNAEHDAARWVAATGARGAFMWASEWPVIDEICRVILQNGAARPHLRISLRNAASHDLNASSIRLDAGT